MQTPFSIFELLGCVVILSKQFPNAVYRRPPGSTCQNFCGIVEDGPATEGCIIGQSLILMGLPNRIKGDINTCGVDSLVTRGIISDDRTVIEILTEIQHLQDNGDTWSNAVAKGLGYK